MQKQTVDEIGKQKPTQKPKSIEFVLELCANKLNKSTDDPIIVDTIKKLKDEWIETETELCKLSDEDLKSFGIKLALFKELKE